MIVQGWCPLHILYWSNFFLVTNKRYSFVIGNSVRKSVVLILVRVYIVLWSMYAILSTLHFWLGSFDSKNLYKQTIWVWLVFIYGLNECLFESYVSVILIYLATSFEISIAWLRGAPLFASYLASKSSNLWVEFKYQLKVEFLDHFIFPSTVVHGISM